MQANTYRCSSKLFTSDAQVKHCKQPSINGNGNIQQANNRWQQGGHRARHPMGSRGGRKGADPNKVQQQRPYLVSLLELYNLGQGAHLPLHAVDALNNDQDLLPRPSGLGLAIRYAVSEQPLQMRNIIVDKHLPEPTTR